MVLLLYYRHSSYAFTLSASKLGIQIEILLELLGLRQTMGLDIILSMNYALNAIIKC